MNRRRLTAVAVAMTLAFAVGVTGTVVWHEQYRDGDEPDRLPYLAREKYAMIAGQDPAEAARESAEEATLDTQFAQARQAPGIVSPGAYGAAFAQIRAMPPTAGTWSEVTRTPYNADDPRYRDYYSNSGGGTGHVTGRITGVASDNNGHVYAAGANGGVFRSSTGGGNWTPIADSLFSLSAGSLTLADDGSLWYAAGQPSGEDTSYVGSAIYRLPEPANGTFTPAMRVGGGELESATINRLRFGGGKVWVATGQGIFTHDATTSEGAWRLEFAANPQFLPGGAQAGNADASHKNVVNDIVIDPRDPRHVIAAIGWRSGDAWNGFYETLDYTRGPSSWTKVNPVGALPGDNIGKVTFASSANGTRLYAINLSPKLLNKPASTLNSYLDGVYVSSSGTAAGPWRRIADSRKLADSGSAFKGSLEGKGFGPGLQAWYHNFLYVDPGDADHVWLGLEEVYETTDGGFSWRTIGPYWNFYFPCWDISDAADTCPMTAHPDQQAVTIGQYQDRAYVFVGNDGGVYRRPVRGQTNANGNATDWQSLNDGTMDVLQYFSVAVGKDGTGTGVTGGMRDNGASILRSGDTVMGSNFGGDGGDSLANPDNICQQAHEYLELSIAVTENCAANPGSVDLSTATSFKVRPYHVSPGDEPARLIAPFAADDHDATRWIAGGQHVWFNPHGFSIRSGKQWINGFDLGTGRVATAVAMSGGAAYVSWCGPCDSAGFARGIAVGRFNDPGSWRQLELPVDGAIPNRFVQGLGIDPADSEHAFVAINGFSRRWTDGPGVGVGHIFETKDMGKTWTDVSANLPDAPANSVKVLPGGALVLGTDLAAFYRAAGAGQWQLLGTGLPSTVVLDVEYFPPNNAVYVATYGRGIWRFDLSQLS